MSFNLIPIPPLDGSSVLPLLLSNRELSMYSRLRRCAFPPLIAVLGKVRVGGSESDLTPSD